MYPHNYFSLFPPFPRENKVFVAMSFDTRFNGRWKNVIGPAIKSVSVDGVPLEPHRVDTSRISDSILSEILEGISTSQLIFADLTTIGFLGGKSIRNGNVMYEVGIAQARRLPEEVLLFRSDSDELPFDIVSVRVNEYDPDGDPDRAQDFIAAAIREALREIRTSCHNAIKYTAKGLDAICWTVLSEASGNDDGVIRHYQTHNMILTIVHGPKNMAISKLLDVGALATDFDPSDGESVDDESDGRQEIKYEITPFGRALLEHINQQPQDL